MKTLTELVAINSSVNCNEIINYITNKLQNKVEQIEIIGDEQKAVIIGINTKLQNCQPIILSGHIDTVTSKNEDACNVKIINGKAYGLGIIDMKFFTASIIDKLSDIKNINIPIVCVLTTDEETKLKSITLAIEFLRCKNIMPKFTIIGEPSNFKFATMSKGCYEYQLNITGKACHSSNISNGINSICIGAKLITFIENLNSKYKTLTLNCGVITGGDIVNRVPEKTCVKFDMRCYDEEDRKDAYNLICEKINELKKEYIGANIELVNLLKIPSFMLKDTALLQKICKQLNASFCEFTGGCEAGYFTELSGNAVIYGVGETCLCHQEKESINVEEYLLYKNNLVKLLKFLTQKL